MLNETSFYHFICKLTKELARIAESATPEQIYNAGGAGLHIGSAKDKKGRSLYRMFFVTPIPDFEHEAHMPSEDQRVITIEYADIAEPMELGILMFYFSRPDLAICTSYKASDVEAAASDIFAYLTDSAPTSRTKYIMTPPPSLQ